MALMDNPRSATFLAILLAGLVGYVGYSGEVIKLVGECSPRISCPSPPRWPMRCCI